VACVISFSRQGLHTTPNTQSALDTTIDVPEGISRIVITAPLCGTVADFTL